MALERNNKSHAGTLLIFLESIGKARDGFLVLGASLYGLGYLVWSNYAFQNNMGILPALDTQYFLAGIVPAFLVAFTYATIKYVTSVPTHVRTYFQQHRLLIYLIPSLFFAAPILSILFVWLNISMPHFLGFPINMLAMLIIGLLIPYFFAIDQNYDAKHGFVRFYNLYLIPIWSFISCIYIYAIIIYPNLPQEFGGVLPRSAYVDFDRQTVSDETLKHIAPQAQQQSNSNILRSIKLVILYEGNGHLLARPAGDSSSQRGSIYEINRSDIKAIEWLK